MDNRNRKRRRKKNSALTVTLVLIIALAVCILGIAASRLVQISRSYKEANDVYKEIDSIFTGDAEITNPSFHWDYDQLLALCEDAVGYIYLQGVFSYTIVQAEDNDKYLRHMMNGEYNVAGTIFVDARVEDGMEDNYSIVYGHNMDDGSMFGTLSRFEDEEYYKEHPYFDIYIGYKHYRYYVFSAFTAETDGFVYSFDLVGDEYKKQFDALRANGLYETDVRELTSDDHVIVLSTCVDFHDYDYRNVVCLVRGAFSNIFFSKKLLSFLHQSHHISLDFYMVQLLNVCFPIFCKFLLLYNNY